MRISRSTAFYSLLLLVAVHAQERASLSGRLTASESPLTDCTMSLYRIEATQNKYVESIVTRTDSSGSYRFPAIAPGTFIFVSECAGQRVFQGKLDLQPGENNKDISLGDPFAGRWRLNRGKSTMGTFAAVTDEVREYRRSGSRITVSWKRVQTSGETTQGVYSYVCDGTEQTVENQQMTCRSVGPDTAEGYQQPPLSYYVRKVAGDVLTISSYSDASHDHLTAALVFDRAP
jgi:hypothetical protein